MPIPIYKAELDAGLTESILKANRICYAEALSVNPTPLALKRALPKVTAAAEGQMDLFYMKSILVTSGWNLNDVVFDPKELWIARATPEDKPLNVGHDVTDVIGHITDVYPIDADHNIIEASTAVDDLPAKYHLMVNSVIYKCLESEAEERIAKIIAEIGESKWYVSMEALFTDFDYALLYKDGGHKIVARNTETAFLSKHLRCLGGTGTYDNAKLGRVPRNIVFSGKGLVKNPANPDSKIFANIITLDKSLGYITSSNEIKGDNIMSVELEAQLKAALEEVKTLKATISEFNEKSFKVKIEQLEAAVKEKTDLVSVVESKLTASAQEVVTLKKSVEDLTKSIAESNTKLAAFEQAKKQAERVKVLAEATKLKVEDAAGIVETLASLNDEDFGKFVAKQKVVPAPQKAEANAEAVIETAKAETDAAQVVNTIPEIENTRKAIAAYLSDEVENKTEKK